jgi:hypothetical protein
MMTFSGFLVVGVFGFYWFSGGWIGVGVFKVLWFSGGWIRLLVFLRFCGFQGVG